MNLRDLPHARATVPGGGPAAAARSAEVPLRPAPRPAVGAHLRKWLAIGAGVGVEIRENDLEVVAARVRPTGVRLLGAATIPQFRTRPAAEWGAEYASFLKKAGGSHLAAAVLLPRREIIVRHLSLPGVADRDLNSAIGYQIDSLHPYPEDEAAWAFARIPGTQSVLIAIARRALIERYATIFTEAGIKIASFTFSAAAIFSASRLLGGPPAEGVVAVHDSGDGAEVYGESPSWPVFSAIFDVSAEKAQSLAAAELRLPPNASAVDPIELLPRPRAVPENYDLSRATLAWATALAGACPRLALAANLLPVAQRSSSSRIIYAPTVALASALLLMLGALASYGTLENRRYLKALEKEIARTEPIARKVSELDAKIDDARNRTQMLNDFRRRSKADMDAINELTRILPPPGWINNLELTRDIAQFQGEAEQAAPLLKMIDSSPLFQNSEFTMPLARMGVGEGFRIRAMRRDAR